MGEEGRRGSSQVSPSPSVASLDVADEYEKVAVLPPPSMALRLEVKVSLAWW